MCREQCRWPCPVIKKHTRNDYTHTDEKQESPLIVSKLARATELPCGRVYNWCCTYWVRHTRVLSCVQVIFTAISEWLDVSSVMWLYLLNHFRGYLHTLTLASPPIRRLFLLNIYGIWDRPFFRTTYGSVLKSTLINISLNISYALCPWHVNYIYFI